MEQLRNNRWRGILVAGGSVWMLWWALSSLIWGHVRMLFSNCNPIYAEVDRQRFNYDQTNTCQITCKWSMHVRRNWPDPAPSLPRHKDIFHRKMLALKISAWLIKWFFFQIKLSFILFHWGVKAWIKQIKRRQKCRILM